MYLSFEIQHVLVSHPERVCGPCQLVFISETTRDEHYHESQAHPSCPMCHIGFETEPIYHEVKQNNPIFRGETEYHY